MNWLQIYDPLNNQVLSHDGRSPADHRPARRTCVLSHVIHGAQGIRSLTVVLLSA
jgi:hypothetical protein